VVELPYCIDFKLDVEQQKSLTARFLIQESENDLRSNTMDEPRESSELGSFILPTAPGIGTRFDFPSAVVAISSTPDLLFWTTSDRGLQGRAGKDYWVLYENGLVVVKLIARDSQDEKSIPLEGIGDCVIDGNSLEVHTLSLELAGSEKTSLGSEKSVGLIQHKWFAQAIVNQITLSKRITQDP
jgi:hypothetical protein